MQKLMITSLLVFTLTLFVGALPVGHADADTITLGPDVEYSGGTPPNGSAPWMTATFDDTAAGAGFDVRLTLSAGNLVDDEFIGVWFFNLDTTLNPNLLTFGAVDNSDSVPTISTDNSNSHNKFKAGSERYFDIKFDFPQGNIARFTAGETVIYDIGYTGSDTLSAQSFNFTSSMGTFKTAVHSQSITDNSCSESEPDCESGWVGTTSVVPEPVSATLFMLGIALLGARSFWKQSG